jgi:hypothetical protein
MLAACRRHSSGATGDERSGFASRTIPESSGVFLTGRSGRRTPIKQVFRAHRHCEQDGPLGPYVESYEAEIRGEGNARPTREMQIRLVADYDRWFAKRRIQAQEITAALCSCRCCC